MPTERPSNGERAGERAPRREFTDAEIRETFAKLGLADPEVRRFFRTLGQLHAGGEEEPPIYWTELHAGTNFAPAQAHDA